MSWVSWIPGVHLARQAWVATKPATEIRARRQQERAVQLSQKNQVGKTFRRKEAIKEVRRLFDEQKYEELARSLLPDVVVDKSFEFVDLWWKVWDIYWIFLLLRVVLVLIPGHHIHAIYSSVLILPHVDILHPFVILLKVDPFNLCVILQISWLHVIVSACNEDSLS